MPRRRPRRLREHPRGTRLYAAVTSQLRKSSLTPSQTSLALSRELRPGPASPAIHTGEHPLTRSLSRRSSRRERRRTSPLCDSRPVENPATSPYKAGLQEQPRAGPPHSHSGLIKLLLRRLTSCVVDGMSDKRIVYILRSDVDSNRPLHRHHQRCRRAAALAQPRSERCDRAPSSLVWRCFPRVH